eukprot:gnl/Chilomastix_cuspidata/1263.p1 GENE.gnl/Chilomastix_cuspidata/1263~~gnl/Chilomastix_cuspidata/1263.p1  ORF type:complete len:863 (+),score=278.11 gnl/Chilomastix_cuspidata/1263:26-2614(+)
MILFLVLLLALYTHAEYTVEALSEFETGFSALLSLSSSPPSSHNYGTDQELLVLDVQTYVLSSSNAPNNPIVRVRIDSESIQTFTPPNVLQDASLTPTDASDELMIEYAGEGEVFGIRVTRKSDGEVIFDTFAKEPVNHDLDMIFQDLFLQLTTWHPDSMVDAGVMPTTYGLGPRRDPLCLPVNETYTLWTSDNSGTPDHTPIYSDHPFLLEIRESGAAHGYFLLNSNAMDVDVWYDRFTWKPVGGNIDMLIFTGETPMDVIRSYQHAVGLPVAVPRWVLGWHQSRWDGEYSTIDYLEYVVSSYEEYGIPLDNLFTDIDYMDGWRVFTLDPDRFPEDEFVELVASMRANGQHVTPIVDPGVKYDTSGDYDTFNRLLASGAFLRNTDGTPYIGNVWPGDVYFPDWWHPEAFGWWQEELYLWLERTGLEPNIWLDMNEPANFCDGYCSSSDSVSGDAASLTSYPLPDNPNYPSYLPGGKALDSHTAPCEVTSSEAALYYTHNLYAHQEGIVTREALRSLYPDTRPFLMTRASFSGTGHHVSDWCGDNAATFYDLQTSYAHVIATNMMGIISTGADIGGFAESPTGELFLRWVEAGIWYPFSRDHSAEDTNYQEPWEFDHGVDVTTAAIQLKYSLAPTLYTALMLPSIRGGMYISALAFEYPEDLTARAIDDQALVGPIMVAPIMDEGATSRTAYFPSERWYDLHTGLDTYYEGSVELSAELTDAAPAFVRGGSFLFRATPQMTLEESVALPWTLEAYPDWYGTAATELYLDDGVSDPLSYTIVTALMSNSQIDCIVTEDGGFDGVALVDTVRVYGVDAAAVSAVYVNDRKVSADAVDVTGGILTVALDAAGLDLTAGLTVAWTE